MIYQPRFRTGARNDVESALASSIWVAKPILIPAEKWTLVPTGKASKRPPINPEVLLDELEEWQGMTVRSESAGDPITGETRNNLDIVSIGVQGYLCFFPDDGQTVYLRNRHRLDISEVSTPEPGWEVELDTDGRPVYLEPDAPEVDDPFRFEGSADRDQPFVVGPFTRANSVWFYSDAPQKVSWIARPGRDFSTGASFG